MPTIDNRHKEVIKKIKLIVLQGMSAMTLSSVGTMPVLDVPKVGYDNTIWSEEKKMLTIGEKQVQISPTGARRSQLFPNTL